MFYFSFSVLQTMPNLGSSAGGIEQVSPAEEIGFICSLHGNDETNLRRTPN